MIIFRSHEQEQFFKLVQKHIDEPDAPLLLLPIGPPSQWKSSGDIFTKEQGQPKLLVNRQHEYLYQWYEYMC